jgi:hypothetical protein
VVDFDLGDLLRGDGDGGGVSAGGFHGKSRRNS